MTLFTSFTTATINNIQSTESQIAYLESQLEQARQDLAQYQQEHQAQLTAKSAAENALDMVRKARAMVEFAFGEKAVHEFNLALIDVEEEQPELLRQANPEPTTIVTEPEPSPNNDNTVEVTSVLVDETIDVTASEVVTPTEEPKEVGESQAERDFSKLSWKQLQRFAASYGVSPKGKKRPDIESALSDQQINQADIDLAA